MEILELDWLGLIDIDDRLLMFDVWRRLRVGVLARGWEGLWSGILDSEKVWVLLNEVRIFN